jgi:predicted MPP superfamily phosphohydrolase
MPRIEGADVLTDTSEAARERCPVLGSARRTLRERFLDFVEGAWAPDPAHLPQKRSPVDSGNSSEAFRTTPHDAQAAKKRRELETIVTRSQHWTKISNWTSLIDTTVPLKKEHRALSGTKILHLTDIHLLEGSSKPVQELRNIATYLEDNRVRPDLTVLTGDLITKSPRDLSEEAANALRRIIAGSACSFFVPGNHDYHGPTHSPEPVINWVTQVGFADLTNTTWEMRRRGVPFTISGMADAYFGAPIAPDSLPQDCFNLALMHNNDAMRRNYPEPVDLVLAGHTHWGELRFPGAVKLMGVWGYCDDVNRHTQGWKMLTDRTLSYVGPGLARYYVPYPILRQPPGVTLHHLQCID